MRNYIVKLFAFCALAFCIYMPNSAQAQLPDGYYLDYWEHETPTIEKSGGWIVTCLYPVDGDHIWSQWWYTDYYSFSVKIRYNTGEVVNIKGNMHSSGIEAYIPARPSNSNNFPTLIITVTSKQNAHSPYTFYEQFYQK